jgi:protein O-mannosyl-transferase
VALMCVVRDRRFRFLSLRGIVALALFVSVAYLPAVRGGFVWDDDAYTTANATLTEAGGLGRIWTDPQATPQYYPLVFSSFWVERRLWGLDPAGYHTVNVVLHLANGLLLWLLLARAGFPFPWLAAAMFLLHPVQVESVAWISERKNVLSGCFYLLAANAYFPLLDTGSDGGAQGVRRARALRGAWGAAFALFALALLSKSVTATLPVALLLLAWWRRGSLTLRDAARVAPFVALGAVSGLATAWLEMTHVGARGAGWSFTPVERLVIAGKNVWFYLAKTLWPHPLSFTYPRWEPHGYPWWHLAAPLAAFALGALLWWGRSRIGRGPLAAYLFFLTTLAPALGFLDYYPMRFSFVADHFAYLAIIGPILCAIGVGARLRLPRGGSAAAAGALVALLAALTYRRGAAYRDEETLWRDTLATNPAATNARVNLGVILAVRGAHAEALVQLEAALAEEPGAPEILNSLGSLYLELGRPGDAEESYRAALEAAPDFATARIGLASALLGQGRAREAVVQYREVVRRSPAHPGIHSMLAAALAREGDADTAIGTYQEALRQNPSDGRSHLELGALLAEHGHAVEAEGHFRRAIELDPSDHAARYDLGKILDGRGDPEGAMVLYREALGIRPDFAEAHNNLGVDLAVAGKREEAAGHFREALRVNPGYREAAVNLERLGFPVGPGRRDVARRPEP